MPPVSPPSSALFNHQNEKKSYSSNPVLQGRESNEAFVLNSNEFNTVNNAIKIDLGKDSKLSKSQHISNNYIKSNGSINSDKLSSSTNELNNNPKALKNSDRDINSETDNNMLTSTIISKIVYQIPTFYNPNKTISENKLQEDDKILSALPETITLSHIEEISLSLFSLDKMYSKVILSKFTSNDSLSREEFKK